MKTITAGVAAAVALFALFGTAWPGAAEAAVASAEGQATAPRLRVQDVDDSDDDAINAMQQMIQSEQQAQQTEQQANQ